MNQTRCSLHKMRGSWASPSHSATNELNRWGARRNKAPAHQKDSSASVIGDETFLSPPAACKHACVPACLNQLILSASGKVSTRAANGQAALHPLVGIAPWAG